MFAFQQPCLSMLKPRLRHGKRQACLFPKSVYSFLHSVAGSSSSFFNFSKCSSPRESASIFTNYLRSHFSVSQSKALLAAPEVICARSTQPNALTSLISFAPLFPQLNFSCLPQISPRSVPLAHTKLPVLC